MAAPGGHAIQPQELYQTYFGHRPDYLELVLAALRSGTPGSVAARPVVFLAGDSTLDNKHWLFDRRDKADPANYLDDRWSAEAVGGYERVLDPPRMVKDVAYWLALSGVESPCGFAALNTAVEESTIEGRSKNFTTQDHFIRDNITANDVLIISVGGNDVALKPTAGTQAAVAQLMAGQRDEAMAYFRRLFREEMQAFASCLTARARPRAVIVCMLYYLDESPDEQGFAEFTLRRLGYNENPGFLQGIIRSVYADAVTQVCVDGTRVIPFPLFEVLDGKDTGDYVSRVEPSVAGGEKMARALAKVVCEVLGSERRGGADVVAAASGGSCNLV